MANELELTFQGSDDLYAIIRRADDAYVYSAASQSLTTWDDDDLPDFDIPLTDRGGDLYQADFPTLPAAEYRVQYYRQTNDDPDAADLLLAATTLYWDGQHVTPLTTVELDPYALTNADRARRYLHLTGEVDADLLIELINQVSARIETLTGRKFLTRAHREIHRPGLMGYVVLANYPVQQITRIRTGRTPAMSLAAADDVLRAAACVTPTALILTDIDADGLTTTQTLALADYPTLQSLAAAINALDAWSATVSRNAPSAELIPDSFDAADQPAQLHIAAAFVTPTRLDAASGTVRLPKGSRDPVTIDYTAGYDAVPADVQLVTHELIAEAYRLSTRDTSVRRESIGEYSVWLANAASITHAQLERLRPYMTTPMA